MANAILFQWLRLGLLRFLPSFQKEKDLFISTILSGFFFIVIASATIGGFSLLIIFDEGVWRLLIIGLFLLWGQAFFELTQELIRSQLAPISYGFLTISKSIISLIVGLVLALAGFGATGLLVGLMVGLLVPSIVLSKETWKCARVKLINYQVLKELIHYGFPLTATFALAFVVNSSDRFLIGAMLDVDSVGGYSVGFDFAQYSLGMLMVVVNLAAYPLIVRALENRGVAEANEELRLNATLLLAVGVPSAAGLAFLAPNIAEVFLGEKFKDIAKVIIPWISLGALLHGLKSFHFDLSFQLGKKTVLQIYVLIIAAIINVVLNIVFLPRYGVVGSAYSNVISYAVGIVLSILFGRNCFEIPWPTIDFIKILISTILMVIILSLFSPIIGKIELLFAIISGFCSLVISMLVLNLFQSRTRLISIICK